MRPLGVAGTCGSCTLSDETAPPFGAPRGRLDFEGDGGGRTEGLLVTEPVESTMAMSSERREMASRERCHEPAPAVAGGFVWCVVGMAISYKHKDTGTTQIQ